MDHKDTTPTKKRGGPQPGSGRPKKAPGEKVVKCNISMTAAHHAATEGDRAGMIRRALDAYLGVHGLFDECRSCINNRPGTDSLLWCINNCVNASKYEQAYVATP